MIIRMEAWPALMTRETAAAYIDGSLRDIDELRHQKMITPVGDSKRIKFRKTDIDDWIEGLRERGSK
ncbi:hypothetical protein [Agromyces sp. NPDC058064]|uniref:hypothetical protein n=1 Tax=Agromyces sp. NPDC058064 TaxID=3346322 RepID=UPI0036DC6957